MKLTIQSNITNGVPYNEYYQENKEYKGLVFIQHGYQSNKEYGADFLALPLARKGYFVVSVDAYMHGERIEGPYFEKDEKKMLLYSPVVIRRTALDIIKLHKEKYQKRYPKFDFIGVSMGAMIAYYVSTKTKNIKTLIPVIGTMDYMFQAKHNIQVAGFNEKEFLNRKTVAYINKINPLNQIHKMHYERMFILNGTKDQVVPIQPTLEFIDRYDLLNYKFKSYESGHEVSKGMQQDIIRFIEHE